MNINERYGLPFVIVYITYRGEELEAIRPTECLGGRMVW